MESRAREDPASFFHSPPAPPQCGTQPKDVVFVFSNKRLLKVPQAARGLRPLAPLNAALDLFGSPITPALRVRLDQTCCGNVAIVAAGRGPHAAELRCAGCDAHRGWLPKQALDFILENSRRHGAPAEIVWRDRTIAIGDKKMSIEKTFDSTNRGALFKNTDKTDDKHGDYRGEINVNGTEFWLNAWLKTSKKGTRFMSLSVKPKQQAATSVKSKSSLADDMNDEVPW